VFPAESWVYRIAIWACWASRAGDGGWSGSREGYRRPVALRPPVDGGLVGNRGDRLPAVATLGRAATPYGARIADAAGGGWRGERRGGVALESGVGEEVAMSQLLRGVLGAAGGGGGDARVGRRLAF
jgi:hypothetical protein